MEVEQAWYYADADGSAVGPHPRQTLETLRASGTISPETLVWTEGMDDWAAYHASGLQPSPSPSPSLRAEPNERAPEIPSPATGSTSLQSQSGTPPSDPDNQREALTPSAWRQRKEALTPRGYGVESGGVFRPSDLPPESVVDDDGWQSTKPAPWRRYFARMLDTMIFGFLFSVLLAASLAALDPRLFDKFYGRNGLLHNGLLATLIVLIFAMPFEALVIGLTGTSIGKWIFGVRITQASGRSIGLARAFGREVGVWFYGLGIGVPLVSLFTLIFSFIRLKDDGVARWDRERPWLVTYRPSGTLQWVLSISGFLLWLVLAVFFSVLGARR